jgi:hypothetical protein
MHLTQIVCSLIHQSYPDPCKKDRQPEDFIESVSIVAIRFSGVSEVDSNIKEGVKLVGIVDLFAFLFCLS